MRKMTDIVPKRLDEKEVIEIITDFEKKSARQNIGLFNGLLFDPVGYDGLEQYKGYYCTTMVDRKELNLARQGNKIKPGDIDILFIPFNDQHIFFDRTAVWEVKIARPSVNKAKNPKSLGTNQIKGLMEDGFPLIGLMHVCMSEPLQESDMDVIPFHIKPIPHNDPPPHQIELVKMDWLPGESILRQMKRMIRSGLPKYIAMTSFGLNFSSDGTVVTTHSHEFRGYESGYFNPETSTETINTVKQHFELYKGKYKIFRYKANDQI